MQSIPHSMAHRGAGASRTNARWHPYTPPRAPVAGAGTPGYALLASSSNHHQHHCSQETNYLITPAPSVYSISPSPSAQGCSQSPHPLTSALQQAASSCSKQTQVQKTHSARANYVASLVDQAVKSLTDIWHPENIPAVFSTQTDITVVAKQPPTIQPQCQPLKRHMNQLPSPRSPNTLPSPPPPVTESCQQHSLPTSTILPSSFLAEHFGTNAATIVCEKDLVPIKTFVQEVLRRSRTTCSVLQSALCYIEAVRGKVPELVEKEKHGLGIMGELELDNRIAKESEEIFASLNSNVSTDSSTINDLRTELMSMDPFDTSGAPTVLQKDTSLPADAETQSIGKRRKVPPKPLLPLPPLPSPLLCPRRTFLAALILASKFLQDRCYSNRAWAKLSGLHPREVGRCERALGDALGWRLWVGKGAPTPREEKRGIQRTKSEGTLGFGSPLSGSPNATEFLSPPLSDAGASPEFGRASGKAVVANRALKRAATLPDETTMRSVPPRYRSPGSLPFSFACPPVAVIAAHQQVPLSAQQTLLSSSFTSHVPLSSDPSPISLEDPTPRLSYSPLSLGESSLGTPSASSFGLASAFNYKISANDVYSPAHSTGSNESSDSNSSSGSEAIATPPDIPAATRISQVPGNYIKGVPVDVSDSVEWFARMMSADMFNKGGAFGGPTAGGIGIGEQRQMAMSMSVLDTFTAANFDLGLGFGITMQS